MKKALMVVIGLVIVLVLLMAGAVALSPVFLSKYKDPILAKVSQAVHRQIRLGDIRLTLFTGLGLRLTDVTVANAPGFREEPMISMADLDVKLKLLPLLRKDIQVDSVILGEPRILIEKNAKGAFNFSDLVGEKKAEKPAEPSAQSQAPLAGLGGFLVSEVKVSDGSLAYYDAASASLKKGIHIQKLDLALDEVSLEEPIPFSLSFGVNHEAKDIELKGTIGPLGPDLNMNSAPLAVHLQVKDLALKHILDILGSKPGVSIDNGVLTLATDVSGNLDSGVKVAGDVSVTSLTVTDPEKKKTLVNGLSVSVQKDLTVNLKQGKISVQKADITLDRAKINLQGKISQFDKAPALSFTVKSNEIPLSGWNKLFPALAGMNMDGSIKADGKISGNTKGTLKVAMDFSSPNLVVTLPQKAGAERSGGQKASGWTPRARGGLVRSAEAAETAGPSPTQKSSGPSVDLSGKINIAKGSVDKMAFSDLKGNYSKSGKRVSLTDFSVKAFGENGSASGNVNVDTGPSKPEYQTQLALSRIDLAKLQESLPERKEKVEGEFTARLNLSGAGFDAKSREESLAGDGEFKVEKGALTNVNLEEKIFSGIQDRFGIPAATLAQMAGVEIATGDRTPFDECFGTFRIGSGKIQVQDAAITSKNHGFSAMGNVGLNQTLNLDARMILRQIGETKEKKFTYYLVDEKNRKYIPFKVTGDTSRPKVNVDIEALVKGQARQVIEEKKEQLKEKIKEKVGPGGEEILKPLEDLFKF